MYFEAHITIEPVFNRPENENSDLDNVKIIARKHGFVVADLLMQKRKDGTQERSKDDTFCTGRSKSFEDIVNRTSCLVKELQLIGFKVYRYKIEDTIVDSKFADELGLL